MQETKKVKIWGSRLKSDPTKSLKRTHLRKQSVKTAKRNREYRKTAFAAHGKVCFVCGRNESQAHLVVHHYDKNRDNNQPENLFVLCNIGTGCGAHNHMGSIKLSEVNAKIDAAKMRKSK